MPASRSAVPTSVDARLYQTLRTAHLERAHELHPASILYRTRRYDFDDSLTEGLDLVQAGPVAAAVALARSRVSRLEVNEPLMLSSLTATTLALVGLAIGRIRRGGHAEIVTYAIGNTDPFRQGPQHPRIRARLRRRLQRVLAHLVWSRVDRVVFGSHDAQEVYASVLGAPRRAESTTIAALPQPFDGAARDTAATPGAVVFVGALMARKGIRVLLEAWPLVLAELPGARLTILGKGPLDDETVQTSLAPELSGTVVVEIDPPRSRIHAALADAQVLTLPSQPTPGWREQIGLPIVEGLSHGCTIVTTTETSLADWLAENGHAVADQATSSSSLAAALIRALSAGPTRTAVLASLPERDGRLAADDWLFRRGANG